MPNVYNRNQNAAYFQSASIAPNMPLYPNAPISMLNYFNNTPLRSIPQHLPPPPPQTSTNGNIQSQNFYNENIAPDQSFLQQHIHVDTVIISHHFLDNLILCFN